MAKIFKLFPTTLYLEDNLLNTKELKETVKLCKDISKETPSKQVWASDTYNTLMTHNIVEDKRFKNILDKITYHVNLFNKEHLSDYAYKPKAGWFTIYKKAQDFQESHIHVDNTYSAVLFVKSNEHSSSLYFENPLEDMIPPKDRKGQNELTYNNYQFRPTPGRLLIFKSSVRHFVPPSKKDNERISIAINY
jgi:uncharacterized protein (TIGR02466 family)